MRLFDEVNSFPVPTAMPAAPRFPDPVTGSLFPSTGETSDQNLNAGFINSRWKQKLHSFKEQGFSVCSLVYFLKLILVSPRFSASQSPYNLYGLI